MTFDDDLVPKNCPVDLAPEREMTTCSILEKEFLDFLGDVTQTVEVPPVMGAGLEKGARRQQFLDQMNQAYRALRQDPDAWREELKEREDWEDTSDDGLGGY